MKISEYISKLREDRGYSWSELSAKSGVPISTIRSIANGDVESPGLTTLTGILSALGGSLDECCETSPRVQEEMEAIREAEEVGPEELKITIGTMRNIRIEMLQNQRESYERELSSLRRENERIHKECHDARRTLKVVIIIAFAIALSVIGMLIYDLTHLDRGWVQAFYGIESSKYVARPFLQSVLDFLRGCLF